MLKTPKFNPHFKAIHSNPKCPLSSFVSFEQYIEVTDYKRFDTENVLPKSLEHFFAFVFENIEVKAFFWKSTDLCKLDLKLIYVVPCGGRKNSLRTHL